MMKRKVRIALALAALLLLSCMAGCAKEKHASEASETDAKAGKTILTVNAPCTIEIDGKTGRVDGSEVSGEIPFIDSYMFPANPAKTTVEIPGENPISVQIDESYPFSLSVFISWYSISVDANHPALVEASADLATVQVKESTELKYKLILNGCMVSYSGTVEELLRVTREREGVYLVEGLSGSGTVCCESTDTYEVLAEQNYEAGENRSFRVSWDGKTATITEADS